MRSAATHLSVVIRFIIFVIVVAALIFAVVHWAQNRQRVPRATLAPTTSTSQTDKKSDNSSSQKSSSGQPSDKSNKQQGHTADDKPTAEVPPKTQTPGPTSVAKPSSPSEAMPSTGLSLGQVVVTLSGLVVTTYLGMLYLQSKKQLKN